MITLIIVQIVGLLAIGLLLFFMMQGQMKESREQLLQLAKQQFDGEQAKASSELNSKREAIDTSVKGLESKLEQYKDLVHKFEKDRDEKYGQLANELKNTSLATSNLHQTTSQLNNILGNVKTRGQWGERMAEDIIVHTGLQEGINYIKQKKLAGVLTKPDYTFLLPNNNKINMDVKFPLDNYLKMVNATSAVEKDQFEKDFIRNVKERIKEIQNRDYINPEESTLDFVLLFIPNEQVYGLIQEKIPTLMDDSLRQKVVLCSPFTLYAMLSIIRQAFENFRFETDLKKIILLIEQFTKHYEGFKGRFEEMGKALEKLDATYTDIKTKNFKQLETKIRHIEDYKKGKKISADSTESVLLDVEEPVDDESVV